MKKKKPKIKIKPINNSKIKNISYQPIKSKKTTNKHNDLWTSEFKKKMSDMDENELYGDRFYQIFSNEYIRQSVTEDISRSLKDAQALKRNATRKKKKHR